MKSVYLLTGKPGTGKTSLIKQAVTGIKGKAGGFYTEEIRARGTRQGFKLVTLDGDTVVLAHVNIHSPCRVSRYGVDTDSLDRVGVSAIKRAAEQYNLVVIDEIGKMELFSRAFRDSVREIIDSGKNVLGTIMLAANPWADAIKLKPPVEVIELTRANHDQVREEIDRWFKIIGLT